MQSPSICLLFSMSACYCPKGKIARAFTRPLLDSAAEERSLFQADLLTGHGSTHKSLRSFNHRITPGCKDPIVTIALPNEIQLVEHVTQIHFHSTFTFASSESYKKFGAIRSVIFRLTHPSL